jgi:hypothetical protein
LALQYACTRCSFLFEVEKTWFLTGTPIVPVHPVRAETGKVTWRMCAGSAKQGVAVEVADAEVRA